MIVKKCIFCAENSEASQSVEHIIPESLGNRELILPKGVVCDKCNNYFARKIEGPVLALDFFKQLRFYNFIENKDGNIPPSDALICDEKAKIKWLDVNGERSMLMELSPETILKIIQNRPQAFITRGYSFLETEINNYDISRFLVKIAIEYYVYMAINSQTGDINEELSLIFDEQMKMLINYVRQGRQDKRIIKYNVASNNRYLMHPQPQLEIWFSGENNDFIFNLSVLDTHFSINLYKPSWL